MSVLSVWYCTGWILFSSFFFSFFFLFVYMRAPLRTISAPAQVCHPGLTAQAARGLHLTPACVRNLTGPSASHLNHGPGEIWPRLSYFAQPPAQLMSAELVIFVMAASKCHGYNRGALVDGTHCLYTRGRVGE